MKLWLAVYRSGRPLLLCGSSSRILARRATNVPALRVALALCLMEGMSSD